MADQLCALAEEDRVRGRLFSAGEKLRRASSYLVTAERLQAHDAPGRLDIYRRELALFLEGSRAMERVKLSPARFIVGALRGAGRKGIARS